MTTTLYATFDGEVFRPEGAILMEPNTRVRVTIDLEADAERAPMGELYSLLDESAKLEDLDGPQGECEPYSFLRILESANLDGPPDWSERLHYYLYGEGARSDD
jgi:hypothetical protein